MALNKRSSHWECIVYPESAPVDWWEELCSKKISVLCSPLHDRDVYERGEKKGEVKKSHYHVLFKFPSLKSFNQIRALCPFGVQPEIMNDFCASARYLCHLDSPQKALYDPALVRSCNLVYDDVIQQKSKDSKEKVCTLTQIIKFCREKEIFNYSDLIEYCMDSEPEWLAWLCESNSATNMIIVNYLKGVYYKKISPFRSALEKEKKIDVPCPVKVHYNSKGIGYISSDGDYNEIEEGLSDMEIPESLL